MDFERKTVTFPVDPELQARVEALQQEGWVVEEGKLPIITYELIRPVRPPAMGVGRLKVDDSKIIVVRAGEQPPKEIP